MIILVLIGFVAIYCCLGLNVRRKDKQLVGDLDMLKFRLRACIQPANDATKLLQAFGAVASKIRINNRRA